MSSLILSAGWTVCLIALSSVAYAQGAGDITLPVGSSDITLSMGDLTFPGAVLLGFWVFARSLPTALQSWRPTLRVELIDAKSKEDDNGQ